uniref:Uncharacterized protein n=1 Tax=Curvibacter symbiont subsp. Hydra magnipapillata TaxID=667019 RepID=C9Y7Z3_CURXX|nr:hypothetical protein Csp_A02440 [Curvibacter putative symbiont of Hydra magnipapillata]
MINIWPIGDYKLCYSNWVYDLFDSFQNRFAGTAPTSEEITAEMDILGYNCLQNQGLDAAAASNCEVMLAADSFGYEVIKELA